MSTMVPLGFAFGMMLFGIGIGAIIQAIVAKAPDAGLVEAASALIADVRRRYPGEELRCEYMRALDRALLSKREG